MTLSYWWMHWFWITLRIYLVVSGPENTLQMLHSELPDSSSLAHHHRPVKSTNLSDSNPASNANASYNPSNGSLQIPQKPSTKKIDLTTAKSNNLTIKPNFKIELPVINQTDGATEGLFNSTLSGYANETGYNQSLLTERGAEDCGGHLSAAGITGITLGCVVFVGVVCGVSLVLYRNRGFNRPQVLNDRCSNPDSSGYIDDASVRDNSEEMYSLDNDSFLNSLEAMTIQNYWTDTVKHTKL